MPFYSEVGDQKRRESLIENKDKAIISKKLVTLKHDAPINRSLNDFKLKEIDKDKLYKFLREMEFNRLLSSAISAYGEPNFSNNKHENKYRNDQKEIDKSKYLLIENVEEIPGFVHFCCFLESS